MSHQAYAAYSQQQIRGTLPPGHTLVVNNYTVQVERYLSQGGFAHVYVVRTANPINNTTQHVLKRIAVADSAMLVEVQKEVDIMRLIRGHPNIVNIIDASWNTLPNGTYEVLILMELCSGGGIIDMMNRRLRERLTEAEILQIFVDVCEAVAVMHNLKPPLLHRDLKVENILQSSSTRYKLCDFGSSTPVAPRPPSSAQEIRALEADLNRHTTLQYRAPEMVDVYLRRPVDEKSDVWALGVLLYKLCYYTTPFEEHGPLAILNVQYRIPPYPVYSAQMNQLISSMLRELGTQRPSVFEVLNQVHRMRGTKSPYRYNIPTQQPLRPPLQPLKQAGVDDIVAFRTSAPNANSAAAQARQTVLDAIAPMRRGRPAAASISNSEPIQQEKGVDIRKFEEPWNVVKAEAGESLDDAWVIRTGRAKDQSKTDFGGGFDGFGDSFADSAAEKAAPYDSQPKSKSNPSAKLDVKKDAFEDLGLPRSHQPSPTLGEASEQRSRSAVNGSSRPPLLNAVSRTPVPVPVGAPLSPHIPASRTGLATYRSPTSLTAEERFPSLDELDKSWLPPPTSQTPYVRAAAQSEPSNKFAATLQQPASSSQPLAKAASGLRPSEPKTFALPVKAEARSQQVTGTAMRGGQADSVPVAQQIRPRSPLAGTEKAQVPIGSSPTKYRPSRPALARKHRSSMSMKYTEPRSPPQDWLTGDDDAGAATSPVEAPPSPVRKRSSAVLSTPAPTAESGTREALSNITRIMGERYTQDLKPPQEVAPSTVVRHDGVFSKSAPQRMNNALQRQDTSSDEAEGPEDVNDHVVPGDVRRSRAKGRQNSVHDLVDLYGGSGRPRVDRDRTGPPSPVAGRKGRQASEILVDLSLPSLASSQPTLLSPATIVPESRAELASRRSGSGSQGESASPPSPSSLDSRGHVSRPVSRTSPVMQGAERQEKPRPQSMFMFPQPKPTESAQGRRASGGARHRHSPRRGSISDMVDLYENLGGVSRPKDLPTVPSKPAGLKPKKTPSPIASRFPAFSPTETAPSTNQVAGVLADMQKMKPKPRRSPSKDSHNDSITSGIPTTHDNRKEYASRVSRRQSVSPVKTSNARVKLSPTSATSLPSKPAKPASLSTRLSEKMVMLSTSEQGAPARETLISPSPERPYGVGKLIDQWQKKTEDAEPPERPYEGVGKLIYQWQKKTEEAEASRQSGPKPSGRPLGPRAIGRAR